jgi:hypothetical protein
MKAVCLLLVYLLLISTSCREYPATPAPGTDARPGAVKIPSTSGEIPLPPGYKRSPVSTGSFGEWLRQLPLKKDKTVYLFNGKPKPNQAAQFAVVDISTGKKDLQQCADALMRLRAEYLFAIGQFDKISFTDYAGKKYAWKGGKDTTAFKGYLEQVFGWCGSASLEKQLTAVRDFNSINIGDILIQGGFPGHAVMVIDLAENEKREKIYMLLQSYQPAQDMHILINPVDNSFSPWYQAGTDGKIYTPEWHFEKQHLRKW